MKILVMIGLIGFSLNNYAKSFVLINRAATAKSLKKCKKKVRIKLRKACKRKLSGYGSYTLSPLEAKAFCEKKGISFYPRNKPSEKFRYPLIGNFVKCRGRISY